MERWSFLLKLAVTWPIMYLSFFDNHFVQARDVLPQHDMYTPDYNYYHNLTMIYQHIKSISSNHPSYIQVDWSYLSRDSLPQPVIRISDFTTTKSDAFTVRQNLFNDRVKILLSFGEHAREFVPVETMLALLDYISSEFKPEENISRSTGLDLSKLDIFIVGILNPDGRHLVETTQNYCWRGTRNGVDINRNFDWNFGGKGSSGDPHDEEYRGPSAFSGIYVYQSIQHCVVIRNLVDN